MTQKKSPEDIKPSGRPLGKRHQDDVRKKIQTSAIINRFMSAFDGVIDLTPTQVNIGKALLDKALPDLKAIEHSGEVETSRALADVLKSLG